MTKDNSIYLGHIKQAIENIISFTQDIDQVRFLDNKLVQDATIRNLEIIGEASKNITAKFRDNHPEIEWKKMAGMRDKLIHQYMGVDILAVWGVIEEVLPTLDEQISKLLDDFQHHHQERCTFTSQYLTSPKWTFYKLILG